MHNGSDHGKSDGCGKWPDKNMKKILIIASFLLLVAACVPVGEPELQPVPVEAASTELAPVAAMAPVAQEKNVKDMTCSELWAEWQSKGGNTRTSKDLTHNARLSAVLYWLTNSSKKCGYTYTIDTTTGSVTIYAPGTASEKPPQMSEWVSRLVVGGLGGLLVGLAWIVRRLRLARRGDLYWAP